MAASADGDGVLALELGSALALFADGTASPPALDDDALAGLAGRGFGTRLRGPVPVLYARQRHGRLAYVYSAAAPLPAGPRLVGECDALITGEVGIALTVRTADCLPVAIAGGGVVAIVHAGWRGLAADILGAVLGRLAGEFGVPPQALTVAIGVGVGPCHYPVGPEVVRGLAAHGSDAAWHADGRVDLAAWAAGRLRALGVTADRVRVLPGCTACSASYHSYRRDGAAAGRQWNAVVLTEGLRPSTPDASGR
jgi:hypothetical protein